MPDREERTDDRSPLERVTGEEDMSPEEQRRRDRTSSEGKSRIQDMAHKVKETAQDVMGTKKPGASE
ncbi:hypothetical protein [Streptomyces sp. WAC06614]|uniref:hypothetical protein n=1 Tax=Streptomyces sp. WAC06614 TaxID=2487416 RepID=UPI000F79633C|nr:hypothetical protein [Streptomyces sp. WAC06614]RSS58258.1 hypothetical protein EF918_33355 [Streptomyces sp. WAC06614]